MTLADKGAIGIIFNIWSIYGQNGPMFLNIVSIKPLMTHLWNVENFENIISGTGV
jgi:hypothetical protein